jgi:hypothetical protein
MSTMADGTPMLAPGTYVRVRERAVVDRQTGAEIRPASTYVGKVVGTDMGRSKYHVGRRYPGWGEWCFHDEGGSWAFIGEVEVIDEADARRVPGTAEEA